MVYSELKDLLEGHGRRRPTCKPVRANVPSAALFGPSPVRGRCLSCRVPFDEAEVVRIQLFDLSVGRMAAEAMVARTMEAEEPLLRRARQLQIGPTELARLTGHSRTTIYAMTETETLSGR